jgi:CubicO group peptidase (beta-lactamase class C family)
MKIKAVILLLFIQNFYLQAQEKQAVKALDLTLVEARINQAVNEKKIPSMVIAVARDGKIIYEKAFGYADAGNEIKATIHTPYQLASASKPFTATAIMMLYERGLINIDSPVTKYVPELTLNKADPHFSTPTVRQVLNHTSGLGTYFDIGYADENYLFDNFENGWKRYGTIFLNPGTVSEYSNLGYGLLDHVIANVSGKTYNNFMASELFKPLQLDDTYVTTPGCVTNTSAKKYNADGAELPEVINNTTGAGNIYTSVHDLVRFGIFHLKEKNEEKAILSDSLIGLMHCYKGKNALYTINKNTFYGLGWYAQPGDGNSPVVWHEGGMPGASSMLKLFPKEGIAVAINQYL